MATPGRKAARMPLLVELDSYLANLKDEKDGPF
jgi:hypothetical protein